MSEYVSEYMSDRMSQYMMIINICQIERQNTCEIGCQLVGPLEKRIYIICVWDISNYLSESHIWVCLKSWSQKKSGGSSFSNFKHWEYPHPFPDTQISGHGSTLRYPETGWWCGAALLRRHTPPCNVGSMSKYRLVTFAMSGTGRRHGHGNQRHSQPDILLRTDEGSSARSFRETNKDIYHQLVWGPKKLSGSGHFDCPWRVRATIHSTFPGGHQLACRTIKITQLRAGDSCISLVGKSLTTFNPSTLHW